MEVAIVPCGLLAVQQCGDQSLLAAACSRASVVSCPRSLLHDAVPVACNWELLYAIVYLSPCNGKE
eukprot:8284496-Heterocapsa_arctica.AAC.1